MQPRNRALFVLVVLTLGFTVVSFNLVKIQLLEHDKFWKVAMENHLHPEVINPRRGAILDNEGRPMVQTQVVYDIHLDCAQLAHSDTMLSQIATALNLPTEAVEKKFNPRNRYVSLADEVDDVTMGRLTQLKAGRALLIEPKDKRIYLNDQLAAHLLGYCDTEGKGLAGVEKLMNPLLTGIPGKRWIERDARRKEIALFSGQDQPSVDGYNIKLTINIGIQHVIEDELDGLVLKYQPDAAYIIVMKPQTGEIMAMASRPTFNPNDRETFKQDLLRNRCLTDTIEPGSIFKIVPVSAALNERKVSLDTQIFCENGAFTYGGKVLKDDEPKAWQNVADCVAYSSNIGCAKLALDYLHEPKLYEYAARFGFGQRTGLLSDGHDVQGESVGLLHPVSKWSGLSITRVPIGQEVAVTPIQMVQAMSVIANGGRLVMPRLVKEVTDNEGHVLQSYPPKVLRQVIAPDTARQVTQALEGVVSRGTGKNAAVPGFVTAGKTGTAQKIVNGVYSHEQFVSSFIGFMPADDPQFVVLVMVDNPKTKENEYYGAKVSAPAFSRVSSRIAELLNLTPDQPITTAAQGTTGGVAL